jgi:putative transcriptional regulator
MRQPLTITVKLDVALALRKMCSNELAALTGISEQSLSRLKTGKGKRISFTTLAKICDALDCQPRDILEAKP